MNKKLKAWTIKIISLIVTLAILCILIFTTGYKEIIANLHQIDLRILTFAIVMLFPVFFLLTLRWKIMVGKYTDLPILTATKIFFISQSLNIITPSKMGDFVKGVLINDKKFTRRIGLGATSFEKILDVGSIFLFSSFGLLFTQLEEKSKIFVFIIIALGLVVLGLFAISNKKFVSFFLPFIPSKKLRKLVEDVLLYYHELEAKRILHIMICTFIIWPLSFYQGYLFFTVINVDIPMIEAMTLIPLGIFIGLIPITIAGIGTRDASFTKIFANYASPALLVIYGLLFSLRYVIPAVIGLIWIKDIEKMFNNNAN